MMQLLEIVITVVLTILFMYWVFFSWVFLVGFLLDEQPASYVEAGCIAVRKYPIAMFYAFVVVLRHLFGRQA